MNTEAPKSDPLQDTAYASDKLLGAGAMGEAYLARHRALGHRCVVKIMRAHMMDDPRGIERMRLEAQAISHLSHENIVRVLDFDRTPAGRLFYVMEYLEGEPVGPPIGNAGVPWCTTPREAECLLLRPNSYGSMWPSGIPSAVMVRWSDECPT